MEVMLMLVMGAVNIACFVIGAKVGQQVAKGEPVKVELPKPVEAIRQHKAQKEADRRMSQIEAVLGNVDRYDGSPLGQKDIPR